MSDLHKGVLDRDYAIETAKHFKDASDLLNELLDYGTVLVPRAFVSSPRDLKAICVIFVQLNFDRKYLQEWRSRFFKEYQIELTPKEIVI